MTTLVSDDFNRTVANAWTGGAHVWTFSGGTAPDDYDLNGTKATQTNTATGALHHATTSAGVPDQRVRTVVNWSAATLTGGAATVWLFARLADTSNYYVAQLSYATTGAVTLTVQKRVAGALTSLGTHAVGTFADVSTTALGVELYVRGSTIMAKAWDNSGAEPSAWQISTTDTALVAGNLCGLGSRRETGNSNAALAAQFDSFTAGTLEVDAIEQDVYPPRVLVAVTDLALGDTVELYREVGGVRTLVRGGAVEDVADPSLLRVDAELPFGVPVSYVAVVEGVEYTVGPATYTLPGGKVAVSDAVSGLSAEVVILSWPESAYERPSTTFKVGGRNVVVSGDLGMWSGTLELYVETTSSLTNLLAVLADATSGVVQLRQPGGYDGVDAYVAVQRVRVRRWSQDGSDERRVVALDVSQVEAWGGALESPGYTLADIGDVYDGATLADLEADYATLLAVALGDYSP